MIVNFATHDNNKVREFDNFLKQEIGNEVKCLYETPVGEWIIFGISIQSIITEKEILKKVFKYVQKEPKLAIISLQTTDTIPTIDYVGQNSSTLMFNCVADSLSTRNYYYNNEKQTLLPFLYYESSKKVLTIGDMATHCPSEYFDINLYNQTEGVPFYRSANYIFFLKFVYFYINGSLYGGCNYQGDSNGSSLLVLNKITTDKPTCWTLVRSPFCNHDNTCGPYPNPNHPSLYKSSAQKKYFFGILLSSLLDHCPTRNRKLVSYIKSLDLMFDTYVNEEIINKLDFDDIEYFFKKEILFDVNISILDSLDNLLTSIHEIINNNEIFIVSDLNYCNQIIRMACIDHGQASQNSFYHNPINSALTKTKFQLVMVAGKEHFNSLEAKNYYKNNKLPPEYYVVYKSGQSTYKFSRNDMLNDIYKNFFKPCIVNLMQ